MLIILFSCKQENETEFFFEENELGKIVSSFVHKAPLKVPPKIELHGGWNHPSYHVYFYEEENDTLMKIFQAPFLLEFLKKELDSENESIYSSIEPNGLLIYDQNNPIIFFGINLYSQNEILKKILLPEVSDSLKFNEVNYHLSKEQRKDEIYKVENGKFIKLE